MADFDSSTLNDSLQYVPLKEYDPSNPATGGSSLTDDLNVYYEVCHVDDAAGAMQSDLAGSALTVACRPATLSGS